MRARSSLAVLLSLTTLACGGGTATTMPVAHNPTDVDASQSADARVIGAGVVDDALTTQDEPGVDGRRSHRYAIDLDAGRGVRFHVPAGELDPMLRVEGPDGLVISNDDAFPNTLDALLELTPLVSGRYTVIVTTAPPGQVGRFQLRVMPHEATGEPLALGAARMEGDLGRTGADPAFPGRSFLRFEAQGGAVLRIRVTSRDFDTIATVLGPQGQTWVNDDANDMGHDGTERALDSTVVLSIPESGTYELIVSSYAPGDAGRFAVATTVRPPVVLAEGELVPASGFAGPQGTGRVLGLYAGITEYEGHGRLYGCADDATLLGQAMRASHLQRVDEQIVLTDRQATGQAFIDGIRDIARRARREDVVMIFWSGHGNVQPAAPQSTDELDGLDETLVLFDRSLTDTEVVHEIDAIAAETVILALDSCHSGGFADDFVTRPGRMGLFSSDEDVLSDTAEPRHAGGYLSWYLRRGVLGDGDSKPRDGVLHAGELTDFLVDGFSTDHRLMNPEGGLDPSQRLVVRRGSVTWGTVLWVYPRTADLRLPRVPDISLESP